jgi:hypothetical protein
MNHFGPRHGANHGRLLSTFVVALRKQKSQVAIGEAAA